MERAQAGHATLDKRWKPPQVLPELPCGKIRQKNPKNSFWVTSCAFTGGISVGASSIHPQKPPRSLCFRRSVSILTLPPTALP